MTDPPVRVEDRRLGPLWFPAEDDVVAPAIARRGIWEPLEGLWLDLVLQPGMTFVNVGANVGYFALWAAQRVGEAGRVVAVEPHPGNCALLRRNVADRGLQGVVDVVEAAASARAGELTLYVNPHNAGDHRVHNPARATTTAALGAEAAGFGEQPQSLQVAALRLDDLLAGRRVDVILTDAQGWDHEVLRGARATLLRDRPVVLSEFVPEWVDALGSDPGIVLAELLDYGFDIGAWDAGAAPAEWSVGDIVTWAREHWYTNLELWPKERPLLPRARLTDGFWPVERTDGHDRFWLIRASGCIRLAGPPSWAGVLTATLVPPPGYAARVALGSEEVQLSAPAPVTVPVQLDASGWAELPIAVSTPARQVDGDPRPLYVAVLDPLLR